MAKLYATPIDMGGLEVRNFTFQILTSDPVSPVAGQPWYRSDTKQFKVYDGTATHVIATLDTTLDAFAAAAGSINFNSHKGINALDPTSAQDLATKNYVDNVAIGLDVRNSVVAMTVAALPANTYSAGVITATGNGALSIDGIAPPVNSRVLVNNEATPANNGLFLVTQAGDGSHPFILTRTADFNTSANAIGGAFVFVETGTTMAGSAWVCNASGTITIGTTAIHFVQFAGGGTYSASSGITLTGSNFTAHVSGVTVAVISSAIAVNSGANTGAPLLSAAGGSGTEAAYGQLDLSDGTHAVKNTLAIANGGTGGATAAAARTALAVPGKFEADVGDNTTTSFLLTHALGTRAFTVVVYSNTTPWSEIEVDVQHTSTTQMTVVFAVAPTTAQYHVVAIG